MTKVGEQRIESRSHVAEQDIKSKIQDGTQRIECYVQNGIVRIQNAANKPARDDCCVSSIKNISLMPWLCYHFRSSSTFDEILL
ncbi:hypothetical protein DPMN_141529 [Dreissena polymorpha]|uniref:Uncharacterized protein n=1 Tax=Dreissena polymorpha TaxID=45954 RepID=A0A9D4JJZ9_DREPO|nr:hypothetical protein DPMN_141529 [Dreissena polymorpha]